MQSLIDTALETEMEDHLGYPKHEKADKHNKRNGHTKKTIIIYSGALEISTLRDRKCSFDPALGRRLKGERCSLVISKKLERSFIPPMLLNL